MNNLDFIYVHTKYKTHVTFNLEVNLDYYNAYEQFNPKQYARKLLNQVKPYILSFGVSKEIPNAFFNVMSDKKLDEFLTPLHINIDKFIQDHLYVLLPLEHRANFKNIESENLTYVSLGIGEKGLLLGRERYTDDIYLSLPSFPEFLYHIKGVFLRSNEFIMFMVIFLCLEAIGLLMGSYINYIFAMLCGLSVICLNKYGGDKTRKFLEKFF